MFEIGSSLREARLRQGVDLVDAEQATKIRAKYLRALEDERFELLPAQTYIKGFLRSYADYLGLDGQLYVDEYNSRYVSGEDEATPRRNQRTRAERRLEASVVLFALAGIAAAAALVVIAWKFGGEEESRRANLAPAQPQPAPPISARGPSRGEKEPWISLEIRAVRGNSSLAVYRRRAGGKLIFNGTLERGRRQTFVGPRLWLNVSNPENVRFRLDGKPVALRGAGSRPTTVVATRQGIARAGGA